MLRANQRDHVSVIWVPFLDAAFVGLGHESDLLSNGLNNPGAMGLWQMCCHRWPIGHAKFRLIIWEPDPLRGVHHPCDQEACVARP